MHSSFNSLYVHFHVFDRTADEFIHKSRKEKRDERVEMIEQKTSSLRPNKRQETLRSNANSYVSEKLQRWQILTRYRFRASWKKKKTSEKKTAKEEQSEKKNSTEAV